MSGYHMILQIERLKETADKLGFMLCYPRAGWGQEHGDLVAIKPKDKDALPIYARDAQFFTGTIDEMMSFFRGIEWARQYDEMLRVSTDVKRERKEQDVRNKQMVAILMDEKVPEITT
jgi:hypothetical protein